MTGSTFPVYSGPGDIVSLSRYSCLLPFFLGFIHRKWIPILMGLVFLSSFLAGSQESHSRHKKLSVYAPSPFKPSSELTVNGNGVFKPTAWAKAGSDSFWQIPAILIAWKEELNAHASNPIKPTPGDGILISGKGSIPIPGETLGAYLSLRIPAEGALPGVFDDRKFLQGRAIKWRAKSKHVHMLTDNMKPMPFIFGYLANFRKAIIAKIETSIPAPESHLMMAVLLGVKTTTSREAAQPFSKLGLSHLFAVSGLHVGILMGVFLIPMNMFKLGAGWRLLPAIFFLPFYILLTGAPGSVLRASGMTLLLLMAVPLGRHSQSLQLLGILFWAGIVWNPIQVLDPGLRLSYLATGGIIVVSNLVRTSDSIFWQSKSGKVATGLIISLAAQWFTFPQVASSFGYISGISPVANLFAVPLFGLAVWFLVIGLILGIIHPFLGQGLMSWTWIIIRGLAGMLGNINPVVKSWNMTFPVPGFSQGLLWFGITILILGYLRLWNLGRTKGIYIVLASSVALGFTLLQYQNTSLGNLKTNVIHVWQFDVGQGDCSLIFFPDRWCGIIDTGGITGWRGGKSPTVFERRVEPWLSRQHIDQINTIVLTHGHLDHTAATSFILENYHVEKLFTGGRSCSSIRKGEDPPICFDPSPGKMLHQYEDWELYFVQPDTNLTAHFHENDKSLVVVLKKGTNIKMIWTGDMEEKEEGVLLATPHMPQKTMVLKAGHHGSNTSSSQPFLEAIDPELVLISCGVANQYHHPSHGPYFVKNDTIPVIRTDIHGSIHLSWDNAGKLQYEAGKMKGNLH